MFYNSKTIIIQSFVKYFYTLEFWVLSYYRRLSYFVKCNNLTIQDYQNLSHYCYADYHVYTG